MATIETYRLKIYDTDLATFDFVTNDLGETTVANLSVASKTAHLLPLNIAAAPTDRELQRWLRTRRIPKNRAYIEQILEPFGLHANDTKGILDITKGTSINDSYSIVPEHDDSSFDDYNLFDNDFDTVLQIIAYTGKIPSDAIGSGIPSELSPSGTFPKTWRIINGKRILYKASSAWKAANTGKEPYSEHLAAQVATVMELPHAEYHLAIWENELCSTCELFNTKDISFVPFGFALPQSQYETMNLERALTWFGDISEDALEAFKSMLVFDAIIANPDRHLGNYGVMRDNRTGRILGLSPIFDNNLSLFAQELTSDLSTAFLDQKRQATYGAFTPTVTQQASACLGSMQRRQIKRLVDFTFDSSEIDVYGIPGTNSVFTTDRLAMIEASIRETARAMIFQH